MHISAKEYYLFSYWVCEVCQSLSKQRWDHVPSKFNSNQMYVAFMSNPCNNARKLGWEMWVFIFYNAVKQVKRKWCIYASARYKNPEREAVRFIDGNTIKEKHMLQSRYNKIKSKHPSTINKRESYAMK